MSANTAILFFSHFSSAEGRKHLHWSFDERKDAVATKALEAYSLRQARKSGLPVFVFRANETKGDSFGEKLNFAFQDLFSQGFQHVVALANDCPTLQPNEIAFAADQLANSELVIGPANDGGIYLFGISKEAYCAQRILNLAWQSDSLQASLVDQFPETVLWLAPKSDVDNVQEFVALLQDLSASSLLFQSLFALLGDSQSPEHIESSRYKFLYYGSIRSLRAPPKAVFQS